MPASVSALLDRVPVPKEPVSLLANRVVALDEFGLGGLGDLDALLGLDLGDLGGDEREILGLIDDVLALEEGGLDAGTDGERSGLGHDVLLGCRHMELVIQTLR